MPPSVATIGFFDGVHRGHRFLINQVKEVAAKDGLYSALITFPVHPRQVIQTAYRPQLLSSPTEKLELLETIDSLGSLESTFVMAEVKHRYGIHI